MTCFVSAFRGSQNLRDRYEYVCFLVRMYRRMDVRVGRLLDFYLCYIHLMLSLTLWNRCGYHVYAQGSRFASLKV